MDKCTKCEDYILNDGLCKKCIAELKDDRIVELEEGEISMKTVKIFKYDKVSGKSHYDKVLDGEGLFHQWGINYEEFECGPGPFTTAIVERPDGTIINIEASMIQFLTPTQ